jgi:hypothetical protein
MIDEEDGNGHAKLPVLAVEKESEGTRQPAAGEGEEAHDPLLADSASRRIAFAGPGRAGAIRAGARGGAVCYEGRTPDAAVVWRVLREQEEAKVTNRRWKVITAGAALAALLVGGPIGTAWAGKKPTVSATIDGKHVRWRGRLVILTYGLDSGLNVIATKVRARKTIGVGCGVLLAGQQLPVTLDNCSGLYQTGGINAAEWFTPNTMQVTITAFDGVTIQGSFSGALAALPGHGTGTINVQGTFGGKLKQ